MCIRDRWRDSHVKELTNEHLLRLPKNPGDERIIYNEEDEPE